MGKILVFLLCFAVGSALAQESKDPAWEALAKRCAVYKNEGIDWEQWQEDIKLLKDYAAQGRTEAFHELFYFTQEVDGAYVELLAEQIAEAKEKQPKLFKKMLKKEPKDMKERVKMFLDLARGEILCIRYRIPREEGSRRYAIPYELSLFSLMTSGQNFSLTLW